MTTLRYCRLVSNNGLLDKKFRVLFGHFEPATLRRQTVKETAGGLIDVQHGASYRVWKMLFRVKYAESDPTYGTLSDLETFFDFKDYPGNEITFYDHLNDDFKVHMIGDFLPRSQTPFLDGPEAFYYVGVELREVKAK